jgi:hypothetical protein
MYTKKYHQNKKKVRISEEIQECPNKPLKGEFMDKISTTGDEEDDDGKA